MRKRDSKIAYQFENECDNKIMVLNTIVRVSLSHDVTMAKRSSCRFYPPASPGRSGGRGRGVYLKGVTFNVSVKCLYDDTNSLPTKYTVFKPKMAQKQNLFDLQIILQRP